MEHRKMGALDACPALLGFGCVRFPLTPKEKIDGPGGRPDDPDGPWSVWHHLLRHRLQLPPGESERFLWPSPALISPGQLSGHQTAGLAGKTADNASRLFADSWRSSTREYGDFLPAPRADRERWQNMLRLGVVDDLLGLSARAKSAGWAFLP